VDALGRLLLGAATPAELAGDISGDLPALGGLLALLDAPKFWFGLAQHRAPWVPN
jgi:hypothetical protein